MAYSQTNYLTGDPSQIVTFLSGIDSAYRSDLVGLARSRRDADLPLSRSETERWLRDCTRGGGKGRPRPGKPQLPGTGGGGGNSDSTPPPQAGVKTHETLRARLQYQGRGLHLPYVRSAAYDQKVQANKWTRADLRAYDDPYSLTTGNGISLNQDGYWSIMVKTDWSLGHPEVILSAAQATRLMINGEDCGLRDYLDDDAYTAKAPINTFMWSDEFRAGTKLHIDVRSEGLGENFTAVCNVYIRAILMRCSEGEFDMPSFPLPPDPKPIPDTPKVPNNPIGGSYHPSTPTQPSQPQYPNTCDDRDHQFGVVISETGQVGSFKCVGNSLTTVWSSYGWDGGQYFGGGLTGASAGGPGPFPGSW